MAGLVPAIHVGPAPEPLQENLKHRPDVDPRDEPGDDEERLRSSHEPFSVGKVG
jgi:hypothetical protein